MIPRSFKKINKKSVDLSVLLGAFITWLIKDQFTLLVFGKIFINRSIYIQAAIVFFLAGLLSFLIYLLISTIKPSKKVISLNWINRWLRHLDQIGLQVLTIAVALLAVFCSIKYASQPLLELQAGRQTHTAITSYWMIKEGWRLAYQTPVAGYPWAIPIEFPIYQSLVALIAMLGHFQLDPVGRLVSFAFLIAFAWPAFMITRRLNLSMKVAWVFCALLWSSPIYLFWGRTFMIETAATFFTIAAIPYALDIFKPLPQWRSVLLFTFWSILGILQKASTAGPMLLVLAIVTLIIHIKSSGFKIPSMRKVAFVLIAFGVPILIGLLWTRYTDFIRGQNPYGLNNTFSAQTGWYLGSIHLRFNLSKLQTIFWDRVFLENAAGYFGVILFILSMITNDRRIKNILLVCVLLFITPILIFFNIHWIHDYYQASCALFIIYALAIVSVYLTPRLIKNNLIVFAVTFVLIISNLFYFSTNYAKVMRSSINTSNSTILAVGEVIKRYTPQDSAIVVFKANWSSEYSYYSERKAFTTPDYFNNYEEVWDDPTIYLGGLKLGAIIFCGPKLNDIVKQPNVNKQPILFDIGCVIWMPDVKIIEIPGIDHPIFPMNFKDS